MANAPQMKIPIGADTQDFEKGAKKVKQEMRDLNKVGTDAFAAIGNALGVDTGKLQQFSSALQGVGAKLQATGTAGTKAFGAILSSIAPVAGALAGLGIASATAAFKALNAEAENFKNTVAGANVELATQAYIDTYRKALYQMNGDMGRAAAETQSAWKKFWGEFGAQFLQRAPVGPAATFSTSANSDYIDGLKEAKKTASESERITDDIFKLERQRAKQAVDVAKIDAAIADKLSVARDTQASVAERQAAISEVEGLIATKKQKVVSLEQQLAKLYEQRSALVPNSLKEQDATLAQQTRAYQVERAITVESNSLLRLKGQIARQSGAAARAAAIEAEAREREAAALAKEQARLKAIADEEERMMKLVITSDPKALRNPARVSALSQKVAVPTELIKPDNLRVFRADILEELGGGISVMLSVDPDSVQKIHDISNEVTSIAQNMAVNIGESIGNLFADLATGENAWSNFGDAALSAFGDMAISVGKIAIQMGLASEGIQAALHLDNPYIAIAAGVALVALGTAVKSGLANVANGNYSSGANVASNTASSINNGYEQRDVYVNVQGVLRADGDELLAVINSADKKNQLTT